MVKKAPISTALPFNLLGHEAESHFHSLQQMDKEAAKKPEVVEELKLKYGEGRITDCVAESD